MEKEPIVSVQKYKNNNYCTLIFNKVALSWLDCKFICINFINFNQFKLTKPTLDSKKIRKIHITGTLNVSTDESFIGKYKLYRQNEDEFIATRI